jgi:predicted N-acetyltransferase YhbS
MLQLQQETADDWWEVEALYDLCFAPGRELLSSYRLRHGVPPVEALCWVARDADGTLAGAIRNWPVRVGGKWALLLGPVAVHPTRQGEGIGGLLINRALAEAAEDKWSRVLLVGDAPYYARFGFRKLAGVEMPPPTNPDRVLGLELRRGAWIGVRGRVTRPIDPDLPGT